MNTTHNNGDCRQCTFNSLAIGIRPGNVWRIPEASVLDYSLAEKQMIPLAADATPTKVNAWHKMVHDAVCKGVAF